MTHSLRRFVREIISESLASHRCLDGNTVSVESVACYDDVCVRISDAQATRDLYPLGSDARDHYNGILKVLRRKQRKSKKFLDTQETES